MCRVEEFEEASQHRDVEISDRSAAMWRAEGGQAEDRISHSQYGDRIARIEPAHAVRDDVDGLATYGFIVLQVDFQLGCSLLHAARGRQGLRLGYRVTGI